MDDAPGLREGPDLRVSAALFLALLLLRPLGAEPVPDRLERLLEIAQQRENWCLRVFALLGIAGEKDDRVVAFLEKGLADPHELVRGTAAIALRDLPEDVLAAGADAEYVDRLIGRYLVSKKAPLEVDAAYAQIRKLAGQDFGRDLARWKKWWADARGSWAPASVGRVPAPQPGEDSGNRTIALLDRLLDLQTDGLDLMLAIDSTGSMQPYIDAAKARLHEMISILAAIIPPDKLRMGLVTYDDAAQIRAELVPKLDEVRKKLDRVTAMGGGDWEEGVDRALAEVLEHHKMSWRREAAKVVIVCGDAAAHPKDLEKMYALVEAMHRTPDQLSKVVFSGKGTKLRPFLVSCVHVLLENPNAKPDPADALARTVTERCFRAIAEKGGGTYVIASKADEVVIQLLVLSFGAEWREEIERFLVVFRELSGRKK